ncbi:hydrolase [Haematobacter missouriensis]|uniref:Hydrolase n=1 Tax=Haematobacter missouriensis TaxID=366616 RepID=A0A212ANG5_9RHOB|nr:HAD family hydrolase [Haematobacter missouriensis]KFI26571.1 hydrolase [Haematobacter missouriensis]OWJ72909.1 hydrolase [Haematobacter missouriensis]OWJ83054.1 hydrolase [Haematobacter missouriensis]
MTPALIIFDCDGVLIDSETISRRILTEELAREGVFIDLSAFRRHFLGRSFSAVEAEVSRVWSRRLPSDFQQRYMDRLLPLFAEELLAMEGAAEMLRDLAVPYCLATSSSPDRLRRSLATAGLDRFFDGRCFTVADVARGKPEPDLFLHAARVMGVVPADVVVLEDSEPGLTAAARAGMTGWQFTGGGHMSEEPPSLLAAQHFSSFAEIRAAFPTFFQRVDL